jgi:tRNA nucleotidyltransferase (CCA-adding enzyme)
MFNIGKGDAVRARRFLAKHGDEVAFELIDHKQADYTGKPGADGRPPHDDVERLERFRALLRQEAKQPHRLRDLAVDGKDLIEVGLKPGPKLGRVLGDLLHDVVEDPSLNTREELLARARRKVRT